MLLLGLENGFWSLIMNGFDFTTVEKFDAHIEQSIPNYTGLSAVVEAFSHYYLSSTSVVADIGCSTGAYLHNVQQSTGCLGIGCDLVKMEHVSTDFEFHCVPAHKFLANKFDLDYPDLITSVFTLQFMNSKDRARTVKEMARLAQRGSAVIVAEKVIMDLPEVENIMYRHHTRNKLEHFTADEILEKDQQLSFSMKPQPESRVRQELASMGSFCQIWQSYNFKAWVVPPTKWGI